MVLRPVDERDYPLIHRWLNDPEVWWWMDHVRPFSHAVVALLAHAFDRLDLHHVEARTLARNEPAISVYARCGFVREALLPERSFKDGRFEDHLVMRVTREGFAARRGTTRQGP